MASVDRTVPCGTLGRFDRDGNVRGAHGRFIRTVSLDGEILKAEPGAAEPIDTEGFPTSFLTIEV